MSGRLERLVRRGSGSRMLVLLHGLGSHEGDLFGFSDSLDDDLTLVALRAPRDYEYGGFKWFSLTLESGEIRYDVAEAGESLLMLSAELAALSEEFGIAPSNLIVGGFSQGAIMSAGLALSQPESLAGAWLMSGALMPELVPKTISAAVPGLRVLVQHGTFDPVLPVLLGREMAEQLVALGCPTEYREYAMGHQVSLESLQEGLEFVMHGTSEES